MKASQQRAQHVQRPRGREELGTPRELRARGRRRGSVRLGVGSGTRWCRMKLTWDIIWRGEGEPLKDLKQEMKMI